VERFQERNELHQDPSPSRRWAPTRPALKRAYGSRKTSVTRELPVSGAVRHHRLAPIPCGTSGQLFSSRCQHRPGGRLEIRKQKSVAGRVRFLPLNSGF
jgi:hypothetical protein